LILSYDTKPRCVTIAAEIRLLAGEMASDAAAAVAGDCDGEESASSMSLYSHVYNKLHQTHQMPASAGCCLAGGLQQQQHQHQQQQQQVG